MDNSYFYSTEVEWTGERTGDFHNAGDAERASRILEKAEKHCLISNSVKTEIRLEPEVKIIKLAA